MASEKAAVITKKKLAQKLGIARSTLYYQSKKKSEDEALKQEIMEVMDSNPAYGYRRVALALKRNGKKVLRVMKDNGLKPRICRRKWAKKKDLGLPLAHYDNHLKNLEINYHNVAWVADFTYVKYYDHFLYLATVMDVYGQEIIGSAISNRHNRHLVKAAAIEAIKKRGVLPQYFHSDQGSEYQSEDHADFLTKLGVIVSMSRKGSPWENGYQESFYSHFKLELQNTNRFETEERLIENIYHQIYYYNNIRIKTKLKMPPSKHYALAVKG
ncbi:IS3 family transposase [Candidatus Parcubacteria bacterium]|nr:IS3 family transposase [Candidatus Parcubacteria bacterium]